MSWFVYGIYNRECNQIYIGESRDPIRRLVEHNSKRGIHFTAKFKGNWELIYTEEVIDKKNALIREKQPKSYRGREFIKNLIKN